MMRGRFWGGLGMSYDGMMGWDGMGWDGMGFGADWVLVFFFGGWVMIGFLMNSFLAIESRVTSLFV